MFLYLFVFMCLYVCFFICLYVCVWMYVFACMWLHVCVCMYVLVCMCLYVCACMYVFEYMYVCVLECKREREDLILRERKNVFERKPENVFNCSWMIWHKNLRCKASTEKLIIFARHFITLRLSWFVLAHKNVFVLRTKTGQASDTSPPLHSSLLVMDVLLILAKYFRR